MLYSWRREVAAAGWGARHGLRRSSDHCPIPSPNVGPGFFRPARAAASPREGREPRAGRLPLPLVGEG